MDEPEGRIYGRSPEQCGAASENTEQRLSASQVRRDYGKPWDFLGVDWARNQIKRIDDELDAMAQRAIELEAALSEGLVEERAIRQHIDDNHSHHIGKLQLGEKQTDEAYSRLRDKHRTLVESQNDWHTQFGERLVRIEQALRDYGIPTPVVMGETPTCSDPTHDHTTSSCLGQIPNQAETMGFFEAFSKHAAEMKSGHDAGEIIDAMNEAEGRVRKYMAGHWSEASVEGVVRALRGDETYGGRLPLGHLFRFTGPDRRHCSHRFNHRGNPCGRLASEH